MSRDEIIAIARDVGMCGMLTDVVCTIDELERFAALVAAAEREACAQVAMEFRRGAGDPVCGEVATAIRERDKP